MNWDILETLESGKPTKWANQNRWVMRIYPKAGVNINYLSMNNVTPILEDWCENTFSDDYEVALLFNSGEPYWSLTLRDEADVNTFALFWHERIR